jgi:hypothetical protein
VLYLVKKDSHNYDVKRYDANTKKTDKLYSFKTDRQIISIVGLTSSNTMIALTSSSDEFTNALIKIDNKAIVSILIDQIRFTSVPVLSSDGKTILYVEFSNAEPDFGFKLIEKNLETQVSKVIITNQTGISLARYCSSNFVCYISQGESGAEVISHSIDGKTSQLLYKSDHKIVDWSIVDNRFVVIEKATDQPASRIVFVQDSIPKVIAKDLVNVSQILVSKILPVYVGIKTGDQNSTGPITIYNVERNSSVTLPESGLFILNL